MKVLKFGGSSVKDPDRMDAVAKIIISSLERGEEVSVVVSAMGGMTDLLLKMCVMASKGSPEYKGYLELFSAKHIQTIHQHIFDEKRRPGILQELIETKENLGSLLHGLSLTRDLTRRTEDIILSFGERMSAYTLSEILICRGYSAMFVDARNLIRTNSSHGHAKVFREKTYENIRQHFQETQGKVSIITGFIASDMHGVTTTLGRGGSDYTASLVAAAIKAEEIQIWTDVDGVLTADPRKVEQAFPVSSMSYEEALEMSHFGAKVIYPPTIIPALENRIPVRIKNSFNPDASGTLISDKPEPYPHTVKGITSIKDISLLTLAGSALFGASNVAARLFDVLSRENINAILITQGSSEHAISLAIKPEDAESARNALQEEFALERNAKMINSVQVENGLSVVAAIGDNMKSQPGISGKFFSGLGRNGVNIIATAQGSSERNISVVIRKEDEGKALNAVHDVFFLSNYYTLNLFIVGVGNVGGTLINQILEQREYLMENLFVDIRVVALANSRKMLFNKEGIELDAWEKKLENATQQSDLGLFVERMISLNLPNSVFIDNTASELPIPFYEHILVNSISISTPNKVAVSGPYEQYTYLKKLAEKNSVKFFYETNVGAGLPVLTTLNDLITSGDRILQIEGVLSGTLSFIFNSFGETNRPFHEIVKEAMEKGYTEPDPRTDLSGKDVARKLLILARESGLKLEPEDLDVEQILPEACIKAPDVASFLEELEKHEQFFEDQRDRVKAEGKVLRYIATLEGEKAYISLQSVTAENPFRQLSGSDNMIVFTTERYKDRPLVIKGPGAGNIVTAGGVFAEILRIGYFLS
ncbi:MAG: bifunctional aspartate kinase/homoserine dehydrogenase I [Bacteroidia bacterium]|nr:bifunctional aspartate kinase/homoserine dehydrogenase I [Bacteroidia bacterium]